MDSRLILAVSSLPRPLTLLVNATSKSQVKSIQAVVHEFQLYPIPWIAVIMEGTEGRNSWVTPQVVDPGGGGGGRVEAVVNVYTVIDIAFHYV